MVHPLKAVGSVSIASAVAIVLLSVDFVHADPLNCNLDDYMVQAGLTADIADDALTLTWDGDPNQEVRLQLGIVSGTPTIRDVAIRRKGAAWATLATNVMPEFRVVTGFRRITNQQLNPLKGLGVEITDEIIDRHKWDAFWDAPLYIEGSGEPAHGNSTPPVEGVQSQPGLPRSPNEVKRASASFSANGCAVKTNGAHLEVTFPGVELGVFEGRLQYTVFKGTNLFRQEVIAKTEEPSVAYKYEAGLNGFDIRPSSRMVWRDVSNRWQDYSFGGAINEQVVALRAANRIVVAERDGGSIAAFPPPHTFFFARETEVVLGYNYYRKDSESSYAFGVRQAEREDKPHFAGRGAEDTSQNFAVHSARPGTWQRMPIYFYVSEDSGAPALESALAFTRQDLYKPLPGYKVMATHFHTSMVRRLRQDYGGFDARLPDFDAARGAGIDIFAPVEAGRGEDRLQSLADKYEIARIHSDENFVVWPIEEDFSGNLGGHNDVLISKPLFWTQSREEGQPFVENHPTYGTVYHVGSPAEMMEMAELENVIIYMPHPDSKGSTGFPRAISDTEHFRNEYYRGIGYRWGMGIDGSETRLCEYRCLSLFDEMNNWVADIPTPPKYIHAITETYRRGPGDDIYANNPVNYVKLDELPPPGEWTPFVDAMKRGDYFVTSGEILIPSYSVAGSGNDRTVVAELEWTYPLEFVEVVWGDGQNTDRQIISATDMPPFGQHRFEIPFDATGKKWVRFAAWDTAGNGALVMPIKLQGGASTTDAGR